MSLCWLCSFPHRDVPIGAKNIPHRVRFTGALLESKDYPCGFPFPCACGSPGSAPAPWKQPLRKDLQEPLILNFPPPARTSWSPGASTSQRLPRRRPAPGFLLPALTDSFPEKLLQFLLKPFFPSQTQPCDRGLCQGGRPRPASLQSPVTSPAHPWLSVSGKTPSPGSLGGLGGRVPPSYPGGCPGLSPP